MYRVVTWKGEQLYDSAEAVWDDVRAGRLSLEDSVFTPGAAESCPIGDMPALKSKRAPLIVIDKFVLGLLVAVSAVGLYFYGWPALGVPLSIFGAMLTLKKKKPEKTRFW